MQQRRYDKETAATIRKAKQDMEDWMSGLQSPPGEHDLKVWQAGYIYGLNRGAGNKDKKK